MIIRNFLKTGRWLMAGGLVAMGAVRAEEVAGPPPAAVALFQEGAAYERQAKESKTAEVAGTFLQLAINKFQAATEQHADFFEAQHEWAACLALLSARGKTREEVAKWTQAARERFAYAAGCTGANLRVYENWAALLMSRIQTVSDVAAVRLSMLTEAREALMKGLKMAMTDEDRARINSSLGQCLVWMVLHTAEADRRREWLDEANRRFASATQLDPSERSVETLGNWGLALFRLGVETHDRKILLQAEQRMQSALSKIPSDNITAQLPVHYNLACVYAALDNISQSWAHLRQCLDNDPRGEWFTMLGNDRDLERIRRTPEYRQLERARTTPATPDTVPEQTPQATARALAQAGSDLQKRIATVGSAEAKIGFLRQAADKFAAALKADPDYCSAHTWRANCLAQIENLSTTAAEQAQWRQAAREEFRAATRCQGADSAAFIDLARYLISSVVPHEATDEQKLAVLREARKVLEEGLGATRFTAETAQLQLQIGLCLLSTLDYEPLAATKRALCQQAVTAFREAGKVEAIAALPQYSGYYGVALVRQGSLTKSSSLLRQAQVKLQVALDASPDDPSLHYNMACTYAQLKEPDNAMQHLKLCFKRDPVGFYYTAAEKDPDFAPIRSSSAYRAVFQPRTPIDNLTLPTISDN